MNDYACLARRFPASGIDGVLGVSVTNTVELDQYLQALPVPVNHDKVKFVRLTSIPEKAKSHLMEGDVVVKYDGLSERFLDILRPVKTSYYNNGYKSGDIDWSLAEQARQQAFETGKWAVSNDSYQVAVCDPDGNLAVVRGSKGTSRTLFKYAYAVYLDNERDKERVTRNPYKQYTAMPSDKPRWAWSTFKFMHYWVFKNGPVVGKGKWHTFKKKLRKHHDAIQRVPKPELGPYLRMHTRRSHRRTQDFWKRCRNDYLNDPESVPRPLSFVASKNEVRWVRVDLAEIDELFMCADWDEWSDFTDPFHFTTFKNKSIEKWN
jgi:hypothetical protein|tara:strand:- start:2603 stop:3562 length:960 start_codon:yes stop_codon:yes gene_type:complete